MPAPRGRLVLAIAASALLVLAAPYVGVVRSQIRTAFPGQFSLIINGIVGVCAFAGVAAGLARIREHRALRYGAIALAAIIAVAYDRATGSPDPAVRAVERFHFIEYGTITFLFFLVWRRRGDWSSMIAPVLSAFIVGIADEGFQWFLPARVGELNDVWLNGVVILSGLLFSLGTAPPVPFCSRWRAGSARLCGRVLALVIVILAAFVHVVHLGVEIRDPEAGAFVSRFTAGELASTGRERAELWKRAPPLIRPARLSREDQYMTEGLQHVQARNKAWEAGDAFTAWRQNLILERYFAPVLDAPSYVAKEGHRWPPAQRADAEARVRGTGSRPYTSAAYPYPIFLWSPVWLWLFTALAAGLFWWAAGAVDRRVRRETASRPA